MESLTRNFFLYLSRSQRLNRFARNRGGRFAAGKLIGGTNFSSSIKYIRELNSRGLSVTVDHLGEFVESEQVAIERMKECINTIELITKADLNSHVSLKLTSLGLDIDHALALHHMRQILAVAEKHKIMITIDMEDVPRCEATLEIFKQLKQEYQYISTVLQAYLYRTAQDLETLNRYKPFLRLVKGAYKESAEHAFPLKKDVDKNYRQLIKTSLLNGNYTAIATHDDRMIQLTKQLVRQYQIPTTQYEFQMLFGIRSTTQLELVQQGYPMRVYMPYGQDWYGYFMRRLAERPANIAFLFKGLIKK